MKVNACIYIPVYHASMECIAKGRIAFTCIRNKCKMVMIIIIIIMMINNNTMINNTMINNTMINNIINISNRSNSNINNQKNN